MEYRSIGESKLSISRFGMGCWSYGGGAYWGTQSQAEVDIVVRTALDKGINFFDTARMYNEGESEKSLGIALNGIRHKAVICSKLSPSKAYPKTLRYECEQSLKNLQTDYIDIYMLHWPINRYGISHFTNDENIINNPPAIEEAMLTLSELQKEGKIREIGISNFGVKQMSEALAVQPNIAVNELAYNIASRAIEKEIVPFCQEKGIGIISSMTLQQGVLTGKYHRAEDVPSYQAHSRHYAQERGGEHSRHYEQGAEKELFQTIDLLKNLANQTGIGVTQLSIMWVLAKKWISSALIGCRNVQQLNENLNAFTASLPSGVEDAIDESSKAIWDILGNSVDYYENSANSRIY